MQIIPTEVQLRPTIRSIMSLLLALAATSTSHGAAASDWLVSTATPVAATVVSRCWTGDYDRPVGSKPLCGLEISNGLVARRFVTSPAFGTVDYLVNGTARFGGTQSLFRSVMPEGTITLDGSTYTIGGLEVASDANNDYFLAYANRTEMVLRGPSARGRLLYGAVLAHPLSNLVSTAHPRIHCPP